MAQLTRVLLITLAASIEAVPTVASDKEVISTDEAISYLKQWRPKEDGMDEGFFRANANFALKTKELPYAKQVSKTMFLSYVLPYSHFDEPRDDWRSHMYSTLLQYVQDKQTLQAAAEAIMPVWGSAFGKMLEFKGNNTPQVMAPLTETLQKGYASCTGMSIFLADCMRAVGIPARIVGTNEWNRPEKGNHNWVEIWMGDHWNYVDSVPTGAAVTWNQTWFSNQAKHQLSVPKAQAILSPLWGPEAKTVYPMTWRDPAVFVPAIDVTANYAPPVSLMRSAETSVFMPMTLILFLMSCVALGIGGYVYKSKKESGYERLA